MTGLLKRLHVKFGHASVNKLTRVAENSSLKKDMKKTDLRQIVEKITEECEICDKSKERKNRPKKCSVRAVDFNDSIAIDLTEWWCQTKNEKLLICHMMDEFSRLSSAKIIDNKQPETIIDTLTEKWIAVYGAPKRIIHDNGGEFNNSKMAAFLSLMGVRPLTTSAYSPFQNGVVERHNAVLKSTMNRMLATYAWNDVNGMLMNTVLQHSIFAKNALLDHKGYSPLMRVYGRLPNVVPGLEDDHVVIAEPVVERGVEIMRRTREAYLKAECDEKIKLALAHKADPYMPRIDVGEEVMYYRDGQKCKKGWHGPARVLERTSNDYTLKHGKAIISCHPRDIRKI